MEKYRVSLEVAKKLKEAGYPQDGCDMHWRVMTHLVNTATNEPVKDLVKVGFEDGKLTKYLAAPCVGRLGDDLINTDTYVNGDIKYKDTYYWVKDEAFDSEADARALCWLELKKRGLN